jgi:hypothetical protein
MDIPETAGARSDLRGLLSGGGGGWGVGSRVVGVVHPRVAFAAAEVLVQQAQLIRGGLEWQLMQAILAGALRLQKRMM